MNRAKALGHLADDPTDVPAVRDATGDGERIAPRGADFLGYRLRRRGVAIPHHDPAAFRSEGQRDALADAASSSGHNGDLALDAQLHAASEVPRRAQNAARGSCYA